MKSPKPTSPIVQTPSVVIYRGQRLLIRLLGSANKAYALRQKEQRPISLEMIEKYLVSPDAVLFMICRRALDEEPGSAIIRFADDLVWFEEKARAYQGLQDVKRAIVESAQQQHSEAKARKFGREQSRKARKADKLAQAEARTAAVRAGAARAMNSDTSATA